MARYSDRFGTRVSEILRERGLSPYDVARMADGEISHQTVRNMANGVLPSPQFVVTFALTVGVDPNELLSLTGWKLWYGEAVPVGV